MTSIDVRLGSLDDVDEAVSVYEHSNLARRPTRARFSRLGAASHGLQPAGVPGNLQNYASHPDRAAHLWAARRYARIGFAAIAQLPCIRLKELAHALSRR